MSIDFTALDAALNKVILPAITDQMYQRAPAWQLIGGWNAAKQSPDRAGVNVERFENDKMYIPIRTSNSSGIVSVGINEKYQYGQPTLNTTFQTYTTLVGSFTIPKQILNVTDKGAIIKPLRFYSQSLANDLAMEANRQVYGSGDGVVATVASTVTGTTIDLTPSTNGDIDYSRYLPPGTAIKVNTQNTTVVSQTGANQITVADSLTYTAGDKIYKLTGSLTKATELAGLTSMIQPSGSYQNLDPATAYAWASSVDATPETIVSTGINLKMHPQFFAANKVGHVDWIIMNAKAFEVYANSLTSQIRWIGKEVLYGGWLGVEYMGGNAKVLLDYDCNDDAILFLSSEDFVFGQFQPLEWEKGTDGVLLKINQQLNYEVTASWMGNIGTTARSAFAALRNKTFNFT